MVRTLGSAFAILWVCAISAQGGVRLILWNGEALTRGGIAIHYGLGYDHDLNSRLSIAIDLRFCPDPESFAVTYRSAYHLGDAGSTSFYLGPAVGYRGFAGTQPAIVPIGFRCGVRGGLERWYADIYAGAFYYIGGGRTSLSDRNDHHDLRQGSFLIGLDVGFGWAGDRSY